MTDGSDGASAPRSLSSALRWLLVIPAAFAGWYAALLAAIAVYGLVGRLCPPELVVSGACTAPWHATFFDALVIGGAALAAALIVLLPTLVAPSRRRLVARLAFAAGFASALWLFATDTGGKWMVLPALGGAVLAGAVTLWLIERRLRSGARPGRTGARPS